MKTWLEHELIPRTFYELLSVPCLSDRQDELLSAIKSATKFLHQYQNHNDKRLVERARRLQLMCARAAYTFSDDDAWQSYDNEILKRIREECLAIYPAETFHRRRADVRIWLRDIQGIASHRIDEVLELLSPKPPTSDVKTDLVSAPAVDTESTVIPVPRKPVPPPIPVRASVARDSSTPAIAGSPSRTPLDAVQDPGSPQPHLLAEQSEVDRYSIDSDRRIWRLTGIILVLTLLGAIWLLSKSLVRHP
jgi:hypothetical protein